MSAASDTDIKASIEGKMKHFIFLQMKLDRDIGYNYWKKYIASMFWSQVSTPINLTITFLTAVTTAQAQSDQLLSASLYSQIAIISLIITTLNTFFRPHTQFSYNTDQLQKWTDVGIQFEKEYYNKLIIKKFCATDLTLIEDKIKKYETIQDNINVIRKAEGTGAINFITDLLFLIALHSCIRNYKRWLDLDKKVTRDTVQMQHQEREIANLAMIENARDESHHRIEQLKIQKEEKDRLHELGIDHNDVELQKPGFVIPGSSSSVMFPKVNITNQATRDRRASIIEGLRPQENTGQNTVVQVAYEPSFYATNSPARSRRNSPVPANQYGTDEGTSVFTGVAP